MIRDLLAHVSNEDLRLRFFDSIKEFSYEFIASLTQLDYARAMAFIAIDEANDAAESHAFARARKLVKSDGTTWEGEALRKEFGRQLGKAADRYCPYCALLGDPEL